MKFSVLVAGLCAVAIFGASPVAAKLAISSIAALDVALLRTIIGGLVAIPLTLAFKIYLPKQKNQLILLMLSGFSGFIAFPILFTFGVMVTSANHASMILATLPLFTAALAMIGDRVLPKIKWWIGCIIALAGQFCLILTGTHSHGEISYHGDLLIIAANFFAALGYVTGGKLQQTGYSSKGTAFWGVGLFALLLLPIAHWFLDYQTLRQAEFSAWFALLFLAIGVTIIGYILWYWALGSGGIARVGLLQFLQPITGVILAGLLLGETISISFLISSCLIMLGVITAFRAR